MLSTSNPKFNVLKLIAMFMLSVGFLFVNPKKANAQTTFTMANATYSGGDVFSFLSANSVSSGSGAPYTVVIPVGIQLSIANPNNFDLTTIVGDVIIQIQGTSTYPTNGGQLFFNGNDAQMTMNTGDGISINSGNTNGLDATQGNQVKINTDGGSFTRNDLANIISSGGLQGNGTLGAPLPVELMFFSVKNEDSRIMLSWATASETDNRGFAIEKSADGKNWDEIGWVNGSGFSNKKNEYQFTDNQPFNGNNYYRLAQYDFDGQMEISATRSILNLKDEATVTVYPSPASEVLKFKSSSDSEIESVKIFNQNGQLVLSQSFPGNEISIEGLNMGAYVIEMLVDGKKSTSRFLVK